jgi:hypothetical protein
MDLNRAILYGQAVAAAYTIAPNDTANRAGQSIKVGNADYDIITSIFANDIVTDIADHSAEIVSIGLVLQAPNAGEVIIALRGTVTWQEWIHDAQFLLVPCPFMPSAGSTEDGFTTMYNSLRTGVDPGSPTLIKALPNLKFPRTVTSLTICGHSLGGGLATLLALDVAVNTNFNPSAYTYASPRTGSPVFASVYNHCVPDTTRIANRLDVVPNLPFPPLYEHVLGEYPLNPVKVTLFPPSATPLLKLDVVCLHILDSYLHLLSQLTSGPVLPLDDKCKA